MHCQNCEFEITTSMTYAVKQNICPSCGGTIMSAEKMKQYGYLRQVLSRHQLTNNPNIEAKLRERLIALVLESFDIIPIQDIEVDEELIDLNERSVTETDIDVINYKLNL